MSEALHRQPVERGAVLVFLALLLPVIFIMIAFGMDLTRLAEVKDRTRTTARLAALAAAEQWFSSTEANLANRYCEVFRVSSEAVKSNINRKFGDLSAVAPSLIPYTDFPGGVCPGTPAASDDGARLIAGLWYNFKPSATSDPCAANYPCFIPTDPINNAGASVNAFRVEGTLYPKIDFYLADKVMRNTSGRFAEQTIRVTGSVTPRRGVFLVDVSPSIVRETHLDRAINTPGAGETNDQLNTPLQGLGSEFAFFTTKYFLPSSGTLLQTLDNPAFAQNAHVEPWLFLNAMCPFNKTCNTAGWAAADIPPELASYPAAPRTQATYPAFTALPGDQRSKIHFASEYAYKGIFSDADYRDGAGNVRPRFVHHPDPSAASAWGQTYGVANDRKFWRVDIGRGRKNGAGEGIWDAPQPLQAVMAGLKTAMLEFKNRRVAGDMAGLVFFENVLRWPRVVMPSDDFDYMVELTQFRRKTGCTTSDCVNVDDIPNDAAAITSDQITAPSAAGSELEIAIRHQLFPSVNGYTDLFMSVSEGIQWLNKVRNDTSGVASADFLLLVTDGLSNCCRTTVPPGWPAGEAFGSANMAAVCATACANDYSHWNEALVQLENFVRVRVRPTGIPIHVMLIGSEVGPHDMSILKIDPATGAKSCMSDQEARAKNIPWVQGSSAGCGWNATFDYRSANETPISCTANTGPFLEANKRLYRIATMTKGRWFPMRKSSGACTVRPADCSTFPAPVRQKTDPLCRSLEQQATAYMHELLHDNPYAVVDEE